MTNLLTNVSVTNAAAEIVIVSPQSISMSQLVLTLFFVFMMAYMIGKLAHKQVEKGLSVLWSKIKEGAKRLWDKITKKKEVK